MGALGRFIMSAVMWVAVAIGIITSALAGTIWYAMNNAGAQGGLSAGQNPQAGLAILVMLALTSFALAFFLRRELRRSATNE